MLGWHIETPPKKVTSSFKVEFWEFQGGEINLRLIGGKILVVRGLPATG